MKRSLIAILVLATFAPEAAAGASEPCKRVADGRRISVELRAGRVIVCDRRSGRSRVVHRASAVSLYDEGASGRYVTDIAGDGRRVAWIDERTGRRGVRATLTVIDGVRGRRLRRDVIGRSTRPGVTYPKVALARGGLLAHETYAGDERAIVVRDRDQAPLRIDDTVDGAFGFEDGRTLRWEGLYSGLHYRDVRPWPDAIGCPRRARFRNPRAYGEVVVTTARYTYGEDGVTYVTRACLPASGDDPVIGQAGGDLVGGSSFDVVGGDRTWLVIVRHSTSRYDPGSPYEVSAFDVGALRIGRAGKLEGDPRPAGSIAPPTWGMAVAVTTDGVPVWVARENDGDSVRTLTVEGAGTELDRGPIGSIAGLRADGERVRWTNAGEPRSADP